MPPNDAFGTKGNAEAGIGPTDNLVFLADIAVGRQGPLARPRARRSTPAAGLPTVKFDATNGPTITMPKTAAPDRDGQPEPHRRHRRRGQGRPDHHASHYTGALWTDGTVFDSSWKRKSPAHFAIGIGKRRSGPGTRAWSARRSASRVLLVVPPADGYAAKARAKIAANATLVFVVDILDAS